MVVKPFAFALDDAATLANQALANGAKLAVEQALDLECTDTTCQQIKTAALITSVVTTHTNKPLSEPVRMGSIAPTPPPRPTRFN